MDINEETMFAAVARIWLDWAKIKDTVHHFGFKEYIRDIHGFTFSGRQDSFQFEIVDEQKFMWFMLKHQ